jgi:rhodanese-related sulfurtransferase
MLVPPADLVGVAKATITECSVNDVQGCLNSDTLLIDIREPVELHKGYIPGAIHLPRGLLEFEIHKLVEHYRVDENKPDADRAIVLYCGSGGRSALAAQTLEAMGYKSVKSMSGGIVAWIAARLPVDTPD